MSNTVIRVERVSKQYRLGSIGTGSISHDLNRWWHTIRGKEDPYLRIGEENDRTKKGTSDYVWALRDISFDVQQGDVLGIIGRNGAGKSTLLKILSRTTVPTTGSIKVKGRIASLLEVGTGFHPELSGRENIFLNGAILGMTTNEIKRNFDEIVDFSGVEKYIDTPVKRYSSGMYVRLAFAVAAHLESEVLIVDEVLAVGDAEFQEKCLGKMKDVSINEGRTVMFVSHNMGTIKHLCKKSILLENGTNKLQGATSEVIDYYYNNYSSTSKVVYRQEEEKNNPIFLKKAETINKVGLQTSHFSHQSDIIIRVTIGINKLERFHNIGLVLLTRDKRRVFTVNRNLFEFFDPERSEMVIEFKISGGLIAPAEYSFLIALNTQTGTITYDFVEDICPIKVYDDGTELAFAEGIDYGCIILENNWKKVI